MLKLNLVVALVVGGLFQTNHAGVEANSAATRRSPSRCFRRTTLVLTQQTGTDHITHDVKLETPSGTTEGLGDVNEAIQKLLR